MFALQIPQILNTTNFAAGGAVDSVAILLGDGHGSFGAPTRFPVGHGATRVVASDFDADGKTDVAVLGTSDGTVSILLGDGRGGLGPQSTFPAGGITVGPAPGDFNEDGKIDLLVTDLLASGVNVLLGLGDGAFSAPTPYLVGRQPLLVDVGDLDADGRLDIAVDNAFDGTVSILPGNGDGTFAPQQTLPVPGDYVARSLAVSDLDGDGILDIVVVNAADNTVLVYTGVGDGSFGLPVAFTVGDQPIFLAVGDLNDDDHPDLAVGNANDATVSVLPGRGDGTFGPQSRLAVGNIPIPVAAGDFNHDGALDLVAENFADQTVSALLNECAGNRPPVASAGPRQILECTEGLQATARLDGSGSHDPDFTPGTHDDIARFEWSEDGIFLASGEIASIPFPLGAHEVSLKTTDRAGAAGSDTTRIDVRDTTPPGIASIVATPGAPGPPRHKLVRVSITVVATDRCDAAPTCEIVSVTRDGSPESSGGARSPDRILRDPGPRVSPASLVVLLRSERAGGGAGRSYTIGVACRDAAGNVASGSTTVTIPHDNGRGGRSSRAVVPRPR